MANISEISKVFNTPNYSGMLYTASPIETPFLTLIGGMGGSKALKTDNFEFTTCSLYEHDEATQPNISEDTSLTAPTTRTFVRNQETNVTQIHHETIEVTYAKQANSGRLSGINTAGQQNNVQDEVSWQIAKKMEKIARDVEYSFLQGTFNKTTASSTANQTRGMIAAAGTQIDASGQLLTYEMLSEAMQKSWENGAIFKNYYFIVNGTQKRLLTSIFRKMQGFALPESRSVGGVNITEIITDFGKVNVILDKFMPKDAILGADISVIAPVEQNTEGKGNFFLEDLAKTGAADRKQIFGMIGLDHGPGFMHLVIKNLKTDLTGVQYSNEEEEQTRMKEEIDKKDAEIQRLSRQVEKLKKGQ